MSFYKSQYQCRFLGKMDDSACYETCSYVMTVDNLNQSGQYTLDSSVQYKDTSLLTNNSHDFTITVTVYNPVSPINISPVVVASPVQIANYTILVQDTQYCLTLSLINPTPSIVLANIQIFTPAQSIFKRIMVFA